MIQTRNRKIFSWLLILSMVISVIAPGRAIAVKAEEADFQAKLSAVTKCLHDNVEPVYTGEWALLQQARGNNPDKKWLHSYHDSLMEQLDDEEKLAKMRVNDWSRVILALEALGEDPANINGKNLFVNFADFNKINPGGDYSVYNVPTMAYILMGLGDRDDSVLVDDDISKDNQTTKDKLKESILSYYDNDIKCWIGTNEPDVSAQAIQGLVSYYDKDEDVKTIIDDTLETLSGTIDDNGCVVYWYSPNACATAQVICALTSLGIDPCTDQRFIKNGKTLVDGLCTFFDSETGGVNATDWYTGEEYLDLGLNTVQAGYALTAYDRFLKNNSFIFNISDVTEPIYTCGEEHHTWGSEAEIYKLPTCTEEGEKAIVCQECGEVKDKDDIEIVTALGHTGGNATCVNKAICDRCGQEYGELNPQNHVGDVSIRNAKTATCTTTGYTGDKVCSDCGEVIEQGKETAKIAHTPALIPAVEATETTPGKTAGKKCSVCGTILEAPKDVPAAGKKSDTVVEGKTTETQLTEEKKEILDAEYKATSTDTANPTVEYTAANESNKATVTIQNTAKDSNGVVYKVTKVADNAFAGNTTLTDITLGVNITEIGSGAFKNCTKLSNIIVQGDSITKIDASAFEGDKALKEADFSECKLNTIDSKAFSGCKKLNSIKINGNKLTKVGKNAFNNIKKNAKITIYAKNKKTYNKVVKLIKKSGAKKVKYSYKKKK